MTISKSKKNSKVKTNKSAIQSQPLKKQHISTTKISKKAIANKKLDKKDITESSSQTVSNLTAKLDTMKNVLGYIDKYEDGYLHGWVYDSSQPDEAFAIRVFVEEQLVGEGVADIYRDDLKEAGLGAGYHGFVIQLQTDLLNANTVKGIKLKLKNGITVPTNFSGIRLIKQPSLSAKSKLSSTIQGHIDIFDKDNNLLHGWMYDSGKPNEALEFQVYAGQQILGTGIAKLYRKDLEDKGLGNGKYGFITKLTMPLLSNGRPKELSLILSNGNKVPSNRFNIELTNYIFDEEYVSKYLACDKENAFDNYFLELKKNPEISCHPLFESEFYKKQLDYLGMSVSEPLIIHYLTEGWKLGIDPHPLFDTHYYRNLLQISGFDIPPLAHYLMNCDKMIADPSPFFDEKYYNHHCSLEKIKVTHSSRLCSFIASTKWQPFHPDITQQSIGPMLKDVGLFEIIERDGQIVPEDFLEIVRQLRLAKLVNPSSKIRTSSRKIVLSVIILNFNKLIHTILSAYCAHLALQKIEHELIVVDNGSDFFCYENISRYLNSIPNCRVLRIERNRFFGEGNNIALDQAKGNFISFLNNDLYVNKNTFTKLLSAFEKDPKIGATGPIFMQQNYTLQEYGGKVSGCGQIIQIGKHAELNKNLLTILEVLPRFVDYCSAACCVITRDVLEQVGGFDYIYEPFYYEDTDLFSRIRCAGYALYIEPEAHVMHFENTSTKSYLTNNQFHSLIEVNKKKFSNRWFGRLEQGSMLAEKTPRLKLFSEKPHSLKKLKKRAFVYSPFMLIPGGGEKYILTLAAALSKNYQTTVIFPEIYSTHRLKMVAEDLGINASSLAISTWNTALKENRPDVFVAMGNEIIPPVAAIGRHNYYHCQFPFPLAYMARPDALELLSGYQELIVNSDFTKKEIYKQLKQYALQDLPIHIVYPPCWDGDTKRQLQKIQQKEIQDKQISIINIGRFFRHGHSKRQDIVLEIIKQLKYTPKANEWNISGTLLGSVSKSEEEYYKSLQKQAKQLKVNMASNVERSDIDVAYQNANVYIHAAGFGKQEGYSPHELEHFGITIIEAMVNGVIPLVYPAGGPLEIVTKVGVGEVFNDVNDAVSKIWKIIDMSTIEKKLAQEKMIEECKDFSTLAFNEKIQSLIEVKT